MRKKQRDRMMNGSCDECGQGKAQFISEHPCIDDGDGGAYRYLCVACYFKWRKGD
jgi:DNA-directed RNA polymerase subunit M/transcription elongation factor TFIIS